VLGRAIDPGTAATLTEIMEEVVVRGTGTKAQIPGFTVAGKTGTAKKLVNGSYRGHSDYNVSFVGFVPSRKPVYAIVVVVDSPHKVSPYGGVVAAPIFQKIASAALRHDGIPQSIGAPTTVVVSRHTEDEASEQQTSGPVAPPQIHTVTDSDGSPVFPDLTGMSARDALRVLGRLGLAVKIHGAGVVAQQMPAAGTPIDAAVTAVLRLERRTDDESRPQKP
jgi:membrane peptidoglycan carboxypeptidase